MGVLFGTDAPIESDAVAVVEIAMAVMLLVGMFLVRSGRVRLHKWLQSSIVLVNVPIVLIWMLPRFLSSVAPDLPAELDQPYYYVPTAMLALGIAAEALGIYILLVAGTSWLPERWRFRRYKVWMRTELGLWWSVVILGLTTYLLFYTGTAGSS